MTMRNLDEIFSVERIVNSNNGEDYFLAKMDGGIILLCEETENEGMETVGDEKKVFTFKCLKPGMACLQFVKVSMEAPETVLYEEAMTFEISDKRGSDDEQQEQADQEVSKIVCVNAAGFVQKFRVKWKFGTKSGESDWSSHYTNPYSKEINLDKYVIPDGAEVWVRVKATYGKTKEASDHVIYKRGSGNKAIYRTIGTTLHYHIKLE